MRPRDAVGICLLAAATLLSVACGRSQPKEAAPAASVAPSDTVPVVGQEEVAAAVAAARGSVVVLNFWATWCGPCVEEMPEFAKLADEYGSKGLKFIAVSFDDVDTLESAVKPFVQKHAYPFQFAIKEQTNGDAFEAFVNAVDPEWGGGVPATFVYDREGTLRHSFYEQQSYDDMLAAVTPYL